MPTCNGTSAAVLVDNQPLEEYQIQVNNYHKEASCWIGSQVGKEFSITVYTGSHNDTKLLVEMDGSPTNNMRLSPHARHTIEHCPISDTVERAFVFSRIQLVDDDELVDSSNLAGLGTIKLTLTVIRIFGRGNGPTGKCSIPRQRRISERGKKGIQACVALGREQHRAPVQYVNHAFLGVVAQFIFHYRPLEYLQAQGIAPMPPLQRPLLPPAPQQDLSFTRPGKRRSEKTEPQPGPSKAARGHVKRENGVAVLDISDEEDVEKLHALRARIDRALAKKGPSNIWVKKEVQREPVFSTAML